MLTLSKQETKIYPRATQIYHQIWPRLQDDLTGGHLPYSPKAWLWGSSEAALRPRPDFLLWKETLGLLYLIYELWLKLRSRPRILFNICSKLGNFRQFCLIRVTISGTQFTSHVIRSSFKVQKPSLVPNDTSMGKLWFEVSFKIFARYPKEKNRFNFFRAFLL